MALQYLLPMAKNTATGQTVKIQDLTGHRYTFQQRTFAQEKADNLAQNLSIRTGDHWIGILKAYVPSTRRS